MCFNRLILNLFLSVVLIAGLSSCKLRTGDEGAPKGETIKDKRFSCLADVSHQVDRYFKGAMTSEQVDKFADCLRGALKTFEHYSSGRSKDGYTPTELVGFLN